MDLMVRNYSDIDGKPGRGVTGPAARILSESSQFGAMLPVLGGQPAIEPRIKYGLRYGASQSATLRANCKLS